VKIPLIPVNQTSVCKSEVSGTLTSETLPFLGESFFPDVGAQLFYAVLSLVVL